jgi:hypothetical protein
MERIFGKAEECAPESALDWFARGSKSFEGFIRVHHIKEKPLEDPAENWRDQFYEAVASIADKAMSRQAEMKLLLRFEERIAGLEEKLSSAGNLTPFVVPIATFAPDTSCKLKKEIPILIRPNGEDYLASFLDANINASGETPAEAVNNLKDMLLSLFVRLRSLPGNSLGPGPARQLAVLNEFIEAS